MSNGAFTVGAIYGILRRGENGRMKRIKKSSPLSIVLFSVSSCLLALLFYSGNLFVGAGVVLFFGLGMMSRKPESYESYRDRYEQKYGMANGEEPPDEGEIKQ